jgi:hypothetical protein
MPYCATCRARFHGGGHHCALHRPSLRRSHIQEHYNYSSDSTHPGDTHFRTSHGTVGTIARHHLHRDNDYNNSHALALHNQYGMSPMDSSLAQPLAQSFATLQSTHVIASLTYTITPHGIQTLKAEANLEREQCTVCGTWFPNHQKLESHQWDFPVGCEVHGVCMRMEDVQWHGTSERHERCFVRGCQSVYRKEGGWRAGVVEGHVRGWHC